MRRRSISEGSGTGSQLPGGSWGICEPSWSEPEREYPLRVLLLFMGKRKEVGLNDRDQHFHFPVTGNLWSAGAAALEYPFLVFWHEKGSGLSRRVSAVTGRTKCLLENRELDIIYNVRGRYP